jgi:hypothetical protein
VKKRNEENGKVISKEELMNLLENKN